MNGVIVRLGTVVLLAAAAAPAHAQFLDQDRADRRAPANASPSPDVVAPAAAPTPQVAPFVLTAVQVGGASVPPALVAEAAQPFIGKQVDAKAVAQITNALSEAYGRSEIALYTIMAPVQDFAGGVLKLQVVEGFIEHVDLQGEGLEKRDLSLVKAYAAKLTAEKPLKKKTLQRYVSLIRDIAGLKPDVQLRAGTQPGGLLMIIKINQKDFQFGVSLNNNGNGLLGRTQLQADFTAYSLFREGEQTSLSLGTATSTGRYQFISLSDAQPIGDEGTMVKASGGYIHTKTRGLGITGHASVLQLMASHPVIRSFDENLYATVSLDGLDSTNALLGQTLATERVRTLRLAASYSLSSAVDLISASATISQGLDGLGAFTVPGLAVPDFQKLNLNLGYNRIFFQEWVVRTKGTAQLGGQRLPTSELLSLGGPDYGRAFALSTIIGDSGVAGSAELAWHPQAFPITWLKGSELYIFGDRGETWFRQRGALTSGTVALTSAGFGARLGVFENTLVGLEAANQVAAPRGLRRGWAFNLSLRTLQ